MRQEIYAIRVEQDDNRTDNLVYLGYPVRYGLEPSAGAVKITIEIADRSTVWMEDGFVYINEGNGVGYLSTFDTKLALSIPTYYGPVRKSIRIMSIER